MDCDDGYAVNENDLDNDDNKDNDSNDDGASEMKLTLKFPRPRHLLHQPLPPPSPPDPSPGEKSDISISPFDKNIK